jgi:hypothetical protein
MLPIQPIVPQPVAIHFAPRRPASQVDIHTYAAAVSRAAECWPVRLLDLAADDYEAREPEGGG